jgi:hypothetical protein
MLPIRPSYKSRMRAERSAFLLGRRMLSSIDQSSGVPTDVRCYFAAACFRL